MKATVTILLAAASLAACKSNNQSGTTADSAGGTTANAAPPAAATTTPADTTGTAASANATPAAAGNGSSSTMTDANILAKADAGDSAEVAIAKYVRANSKNAGVKAYAELLEVDHGKGISKVEATAKKASITMQLPANDTTAQETSHVLDHLKSLKGNDLDTAFVNHEIEDHQHDIDDAKQMASQAQNADVKALLQNELPELQKHLDRAQALSNKLGSAKK